VGDLISGPTTPADFGLTAAQVAPTQALVSGAGNPRKWVELLSCQNAALWDDRAGAGMTVSVDTAVMFDGKPTLRLDIPAGSSGTYRVGTTAATIAQPYNWDGKQLAMAVMSSNMTACDGFTGVLLGDSGLATNLYTLTGQRNAANVPEAAWVANEWMLTHGTIVTPTGAPTTAGLKRLRVNFTITSVGTATSLWIGFIGAVAPKKTTVVLSIDDGYASGYSFIAPLARYYKIPVSFGIDRFYTGTANYMTAAQIQELHADPSNLFEFVTHGYNNLNVTGRDDAYVQDQIDTRAFLRSLGINGDGPKHHPWVQSLQTNQALAGLKAAGFLSARIGAVTPKSVHDSHFYTGQDKRAFQLVNCTTLTTGLTLAAAQTAITAAVTEGYGMTHVNAHDFAAADAASPPTWSYDKMVDLMGWLDAQRTAGNIDIMAWGRWYGAASGVGYTK